MKREGKSKPVYVCSHGDMTVSVLKAKLRAYHDFGEVQVYNGYRSCVQRSVWDHKTGGLRSQQIWMDFCELDHLRAALDECYSGNVRKCRRGYITIKLWRAKRSFMLRSGTISLYNGYHACVRRNFWDHKTGRLRSQQIWMNDEELDHLTTALDKLYSHLGNTAFKVNDAQIAKAAAAAER